MTKTSKPQSGRVLAIAPSTRGFGFAVLESAKLLDWGIKSVTRQKNKQSLLKVGKLVDRYCPDVFVMGDYSGKGSRRAPRIRMLAQEILNLGKTRQIGTRLISSQQLRKCLLLEPRATKHTIAEAVANLFPQELASRLPRKRRPWESEAYQMGIFEAVALGLAFKTH